MIDLGGPAPRALFATCHCFLALPRLASLVLFLTLPHTSPPLTLSNLPLPPTCSNLPPSPLTFSNLLSLTFSNLQKHPKTCTNKQKQTKTILTNEGPEGPEDDFLTLSHTFSYLFILSHTFFHLPYLLLPSYTFSAFFNLLSLLHQNHSNT